MNGMAVAFHDHDEQVELMEQITLSNGERSGSILAASHDHHHSCNHTCHGTAHVVAIVAQEWLSLGVAARENPAMIATLQRSRSVKPPIHPPQTA